MIALFTIVFSLLGIAILFIIPLTAKEFELKIADNGDFENIECFILAIGSFISIALFVLGFFNNPYALLNIFFIPINILYLLSDNKGEGYLYQFTKEGRSD